MTFGGSNFSDFPENQLFQECRFRCIFEEEGTAVLKMIFPQESKTALFFNSPKLANEANCLIANVE